MPVGTNRTLCVNRASRDESAAPYLPYVTCRGNVRLKQESKMFLWKPSLGGWGGELGSTEPIRLSGTAMIENEHFSP